MDRKGFIKSNSRQMISDLERLVSFPSVLDPDSAVPGAPFGREISCALQCFLKMGEDIGMTAVNYDGFAGELTLGTGEYMVGILGHIDVVSAGQGWDTPPFQLIERNGRLYGRGSSDDKGPLVSCLYAIRYIKERGLLPQDRCIRFIVGTDEEEGLRCIDHYVKAAPRLPDISFVPDGYFPLVNCEKGLIDFDLRFPIRTPEHIQAKVTALSGGTGRNLTAGSARCELSVPEENREAVFTALCSVPELEVSRTEAGYIVETQGISVHAMQPEKGRNAVSLIIEGLKQSGIRFSIQEFLDAYHTTIGMDFNGQRLGCDFQDERSGILTLNIGMVELEGDEVILRANTRYPTSISYEKIRSTLIEKLERAGFRYEECLSMPPLDIPRDAPLIEKLMESYREITGDMEHDAFSIGGATYARSIPNAVSFGPLFPYETELAHEANECLAVESLERMTEIYIAALEKLLQD